jgi:hypothetical protein
VWKDLTNESCAASAARGFCSSSYLSSFLFLYFIALFLSFLRLYYLYLYSFLSCVFITFIYIRISVFSYISVISACPVVRGCHPCYHQHCDGSNLVITVIFEGSATDDWGKSPGTSMGCHERWERPAADRWRGTQVRAATERGTVPASEPSVGRSDVRRQQRGRRSLSIQPVSTASASHGVQKRKETAFLYTLWFSVCNGTLVIILQTGNQSKLLYGVCNVGVCDDNLSV